MNRSDALNGALVADAATMGLHWMYKQSVLEQTAAATAGRHCRSGIRRTWVNAFTYVKRHRVIVQLRYSDAVPICPVAIKSSECFCHLICR